MHTNYDSLHWVKNLLTFSKKLSPTGANEQQLGTGIQRGDFRVDLVLADIK